MCRHPHTHQHTLMWYLQRCSTWCHVHCWRCCSLRPTVTSCSALLHLLIRQVQMPSYRASWVAQRMAWGNGDNTNWHLSCKPNSSCNPKTPRPPILVKLNSFTTEFIHKLIRNFVSPCIKVSSHIGVRGAASAASRVCRICRTCRSTQDLGSRYAYEHHERTATHGI